MDRELGKSELAKYRELLLNLKAQLEDSIQNGANRTKPVELDQPTVGRLSRMDAMQHQQMAKATKRQMELRLAQVKKALRLFEDDPDEYGLCRNCGESIGRKRLAVRPEAPFCIECQSMRE